MSPPSSQPAPGPTLRAKQGSISIQVGDDAAAVVRVPTDEAWSVTAPDPHVAQLWLGRAIDHWVIAQNEASLLGELSQGADGLANTLDWSAIATRLELGHALLVPSVISGVVALPAGVTVPLGPVALDEVLGASSINLEPVATPREEFLEHLRARYSEATRSGSGLVFASAGWDSRLEIALLHSALGRSGSLHLAHVFTSKPESDVVTAIASAIGASLTIMRPQPLFDSGMQWHGLRSQLSRRATWRPAVPIIAALASEALAAMPDVPVFGMISFDMKGRNYERPVPVRAPRSGKIRARAVAPSGSGHTTSSDDIMAQQDSLWADLIRPIRDWPRAAQWDYLTWAVRYGYTLGHRLQVLRGMVNPAPWHGSDLLQEFMGLEPTQKSGTSFIRYAIDALAPELNGIPVIASSGDGNQGTDAIPQDYSLSASAASSGIISNSDGAPPWISHSDIAVDPYSEAFSVLARQATFTLRSPVALQALRMGLGMGGAGRMNGLQLAEFLEVASSQPR